MKYIKREQSRTIKCATYDTSDLEFIFETELASIRVKISDLLHLLKKFHQEHPFITEDQRLIEML